MESLIAPIDLTLSDLERSKSRPFGCHLDVTLCSLLEAGFSAVPAVFFVKVIFKTR